jgi:hypothetical protein
MDRQQPARDLRNNGRVEAEDGRKERAHVHGVIIWAGRRCYAMAGGLT